MTFLFDIGKVLLDFDFRPSLARLVASDEAEAEQKLAAILAGKDDFEAGKTPLEIFVPTTLATLGEGVSEAALLSAWRDIFTPNLPMWNDVEQLHRAGHRLILFSNTNAIHVPWILENYPIFRFFDEAVYSFEVGAIKPQREIYQHAIEKFDLIPAETRYIDDLAANIAQGVEFGFRCHHYRLDEHLAFESWLTRELA